jgi:pyruvate/2-oxoglutarate dehydrogenase complex dihydrolipoamide dehydrogenase (E3) component
MEKVHRVIDWAEQKKIEGFIMPNYDAVIIGTGQSGPALARRLLAADRKVAIERKLFGGTCVNESCTPTNTLVASAHVAHVPIAASGLTGAVNVDMKAVKARKDAVMAVFRMGSSNH